MMMPGPDLDNRREMGDDCYDECTSMGVGRVDSFVRFIGD